MRLNYAALVNKGIFCSFWSWGFLRQLRTLRESLRISSGNMQRSHRESPTTTIKWILLQGHDGDWSPGGSLWTPVTVLDCLSLGETKPHKRSWTDPRVTPWGARLRDSTCVVHHTGLRKLLRSYLISELGYENESCPVFSNSLLPHRLYGSWNSPGQNTRVGSFSLLQIFPTQRSNPGLPHCRQSLYQLNHQGSPKITSVGSLSLLQWIFPTQE